MLGMIRLDLLSDEIGAIEADLYDIHTADCRLHNLLDGYALWDKHVLCLERLDAIDEDSRMCI